MPNVRHAPTHRVDLTRPERRSITVRAPRRRATAHFPFVDSDPFSHNYTSSPYVGANSDEEKASNESDAEDEENIARANYARYKENDFARRATLFDGVKVTDISYSDPDPTSLQYVSDAQGVSQSDSDNSLQDMYASYELRANNYLTRLQKQDPNAYIGETIEASPITLLPRLNEREIAYAVAAYNNNSRLREHYRCRYMPRCADVFYRRVLEIVYFMSQYFYSFSLQKKIHDMMPDVMYDRDNICDLHAIVQSRVKRLMKRKLSRDATSTERKIHQQDLAAWQSFLQGILQYTLSPVPYSHRCSESITTPRLPLLPLPDVAFKAPSGWNHSPSHADTSLPVSSNAQVSGPHSGTRQATSLARGANDPTVIETVTSRRPRNQGHLTGPTHLDYPHLRSRGVDADRGRRGAHFSLGCTDRMQPAPKSVTTHQHVYLVSALPTNVSASQFPYGACYGFQMPLHHSHVFPQLMEQPYTPQMHPYSYSQDLYPVFYPSHDTSLEMRELQHVADPFRQHFYPSHSSYDPHFDPHFLCSHDEISSSTRSTSVQEPTVSFEPAPRLDPVVEKLFPPTSSSDSSNLLQLPDSLPSTVPVSLSESTSYLAPTVEGIISSALVSIPHDSLDPTVTPLPLTKEESSPPVNADVPTTAIPTAKSIVYNN